MVGQKVVNINDWKNQQIQDPLMIETKNIQLQSSGASKQQEILDSIKKETTIIIQSLKNKSQENKTENLGIIRINILPNKNLKIPIEAFVERDGESYLARTHDIPLYGYGEDAIEAVNTLKYEIESLYDDLMEDDNFSDEWLRIKEYLKTRIIDK